MNRRQPCSGVAIDVYALVAAAVCFRQRIIERVDYKDKGDIH